MEKIRIGNDIEVRWAIFARQGKGYHTPYDLTGKDVSLVVSTPFGKQTVSDMAIEGNVVKWTFYGKDQKHTGKYKLTLVENSGKVGMRTIDVCDAFHLVDCACKTRDCGCDNEDLELIVLDFSSSIEVGAPSGGASVDLSRHVATFKQTFSDEQKAQARENIGAVSADYVIAVFEEIKALIKNGDPQGAIAVLDNAILDLAILS